MKPIWKDVLLALTMGMLVPGILIHFAAMYLDKREPAPEIIQLQTVPVEQNLPEKVDLTMKLRGASGNVTQMDMDEYLVKVVLAEMPAYFEEEALKAQAVVARTYARKAFETGGKHGDGSVCVKPSCCQGYREEATYLKEGGAEADIEKIRHAVLATSGQVLQYEGKLIEATYFSCSGGTTEDAAAVWGTDFPYLRAVESPGEEDAAYYTDTKTFSKEEFQEKLGTTLAGTPLNWIDSITYTPGDGVAEMIIDGNSFSGTELRSLLGLRSTAFEINVGENMLVVTTRGFGHRVGMSQYGADAMAATGADYREILSHYYQGTELKTLEAS